MLFRLRTILIASDLSERAGHVVGRAAELASLAEAELHVLHVAGEGISGRERQEALERVREQVEANLPERRLVTGSHVARGEPDVAILQYGRDLGADLIVIGPHRGAPGEERDLGTTADRLVRYSDVPCLVMHGPMRLPLHAMLVPSDLSPASEGALEIALNWGTALRMPRGSGESTRLLVLQVVPPDGDDRPDPEEWAERERRLRDHARTVVGRCPGRVPLVLRETLVYGSQPANEILRFSDENDVDLVVIGTHGENPVTRAAIGSVSSAVARRSARPVLLVPPATWRRGA
jgi:nucleotide-binding universal stress UspA family protein